MKGLWGFALFLMATIGLLYASTEKPIDELRRLQRQGYSWQVYIGEETNEPAVCVLLEKGGKKVEGCDADSLSAAILAAKRKLR